MFTEMKSDVQEMDIENSRSFNEARVNLRVTIPDMTTVTEATTPDSDPTPTSADWQSDLYAETISSDNDITNSCLYTNQQRKVFSNEQLQCRNSNKKKLLPANIVFAVTQQQGWETLGLRSKRAAKNTHPVIEDAYNIPSAANDSIHTPTNITYNIFVLADGHGGPNAAEHFCHVMPGKVRDLMNSELNWNFKDVRHQQIFREKMRNLFKTLDEEYLSTQKKKFSDWMGIGRPEPILADEGSTLVVLVVFDGVVIISNIGDSKTILCKVNQSCNGTNPKMKLDLIYQSTDQSPGHPYKAYQIYKNGGVFRREENEKIIRAKVNPPTPYPRQPSDASKATLIPIKAHHSLQKARVSRPQGYTNVYGLPNDQSVNIGDTMGDLFFKLDPPLFSCEPDIEFVMLELDIEYLGIMAPDGLWDHLIVKMPEFLRKIGRYMGELASNEGNFEEAQYECKSSYSSTSSSEEESNYYDEPVVATPSILKKSSASLTTKLTWHVVRELSISLCDRLEDPIRIFAKDQGRYDDCTVITFSVKFQET